MNRVYPAPPSSELPPRPWWAVALAALALVILFAGLMLALRWCGGGGERRRIRSIPLPPLVTSDIPAVVRGT